MMKNLNKREIILLILAIIIIGGTTGYRRYIKPMIERQRALKKELINKRNYIKKMEFKLGTGKRYLEEYRKTGQKIEKVEKLFYKGKEEDIKIEILNRVQEQIKRSGLEIKDKNVWIEKPQDIQGQKHIYCNINLEGDFDEMVNWLREMRRDREKLLEPEKLEMIKNREILRINVLYRGIVLEE